MIDPRERTQIFIDGANLYACCRALDMEIDYKKLKAYFESLGYVMRMNYYSAVLESEEFVGIRPLIDWLDYNGYRLVTKAAKEYTDSMGRRKVKGNMDIEIAIDVLEQCARTDHIILFTGDGDFVPLIHAAQRKGVKVSVVSTTKASQSVTSDELRRAADHFIDLDDIKHHISRERRDVGQG